jgi:spore coat polysaccharide biosynthesis protein SpsF
MSSSRLPGKVLKSIAGRPLLDYLLESLNAPDFGYPFAVVTSTEPSDDAIAQFCSDNQVQCFRGSLEKVAQRFYEAAQHFGWESFVRISGDSPLLDHRLIARAIALFNEADFDLVSNVQERTFPKGQSVEVIRTQTLGNSIPLFTASEDQEHVTRFFYKNPAEFKIYNFRSLHPLSHLNFCVDTHEDFQFIEQLISSLSLPHWQYDVTGLTRMIRTLPKKETGT